jgi:hypothetical protein
MGASGETAVRRDDRGAGRVVATVVGRLLGAVIAAVARERPASKPLHPRGSVGRGLLNRLGGDVRSGTAWLDEPGQDEVLVRLSRSVGLPPPAPDVVGLAVRVPTGPGAFGDLLFASTGKGPLSRFVVTPTWSPYRRTMTTLLPYRTQSGPVLLSADRIDDRTVELCWARGSGRWHRFGTLQLGDESVSDQDADVSFDPVRNKLPGLEAYAWVRGVREPSYRSARRSRGLSG